MRPAPFALWIALAAALPSGGAAQVFRCGDESSPQFQGTPCDSGSRPITVPIHVPDRAARAAAAAVQRKEQRFVETAEKERDTARRQAFAERQQRERDKQAHEKRCAGYLERAERAEADARTHHSPRSRQKRDYELRARELRDRHFSECFAPG